MLRTIGEPLRYHQDEEGDYYDPARLASWLEAKYARHHEEEDLYAAEMLRWFAKLPPAASGNVEEHSVASLKGEGPVAAPEALTDEQIEQEFEKTFDTSIAFHTSQFWEVNGDIDKAALCQLVRALASQPVAVEREES
jgi:hypothetical protein